MPRAPGCAWSLEFQGNPYFAPTPGWLWQLEQRSKLFGCFVRPPPGAAWSLWQPEQSTVGVLDESCGASVAGAGAGAIARTSRRLATDAGAIARATLVARLIGPPRRRRRRSPRPVRCAPRLRR